MQMSRALSALLAAMVSIAVFAAPSEHTKTEIDHLFNYLKSSGCKFNRNGKWYAADAASKHLQTKYDYLVKEGLITSTESFVELGASGSRISFALQIRTDVNSQTACGCTGRTATAAAARSDRREAVRERTNTPADCGRSIA